MVKFRGVFLAPIIKSLVCIFLFFQLGCVSQSPISSSVTSNEVGKEKRYQISLNDEYNWLVDSQSQKTKKWVREQNKKTDAEFMSSSQYEKVFQQTYKLATSENRIPTVQIRGNFIYNFWMDKKYPLGIWRRILSKDFLNNEIKWETLLNLELFNKKNNSDYAFQESRCLGPQFKRCLIYFSTGDSDKHLIKEFDLNSKKFIKSGFNLDKEAMTEVRWLNNDEIEIISDFGPNSINQSKFGLQIKDWKRGKDLATAPLLFSSLLDQGKGVFFESENEYPETVRYISDYSGFLDKTYYFFQNNSYSLPLQLPQDAFIIGILNDTLIIKLEKAWEYQNQIFVQDSLITMDLPLFLSSKKQNFKVLYQPDASEVIQEVDVSKHFVWIKLLKNVTNKILKMTPSTMQQVNGTVKIEYLDLPEQGDIQLEEIQKSSDDFFILYDNLLIPSQMYFVHNGILQKKPIKKLSAWFESKDLVSEQKWTKSKDGTIVPYFVIHKKNMKYDSSNPTIIYGYGADGDVVTPTYLGAIGTSWCAKNGVYVMANLRGGGEFGLNWKNQGMLEFKQNTFDDFIAITEDLIRSKITQPKKIGIWGSSWGGLLVTAVMLQRPELFGAVSAEAPMTDMLNYPLMPIGEEWVPVFGDPRTEKYHAVLEQYSPYQNIKKNINYPSVLILTATNDDRMHPAHARRFAAKMLDQGHKTYFYEFDQGGHYLNQDKDQFATRFSLRFRFFAQTLGLK